MNTLSDEKKALRERIGAARDAMTVEQRAEDSAILTHLLIANIRYQRARTVLAYCGFGTEVDTASFLQIVLDEGKTLALPRIDSIGNSLALYRVTDLSRDLEAGQWGILEPKAEPSRIFALREADFVVTPGLAFDAQCNRMGYGKAYYDRLFTNCPGQLPFRIAIAFDCQIVDRIPVTSSDVALDAVVTPTQEFLS